MRWSDERILTTHTGSLPRPPELTRLYVRRARGEVIDRAELDRVGHCNGLSTSRSKPVSISATTASSNARRFFSTSGIV
jgi:hypothetical protein